MCAAPARNSSRGTALGRRKGWPGRGGDGNGRERERVDSRLGREGMTQFSKRLTALPTYPMAEIPALKRRLVQQGVDVIDVGAGDADFAPPEVAVEALAHAIRDPAMSRYALDRKSTRLNSSHGYISYAVFCLKKKKNTN